MEKKLLKKLTVTITGALLVLLFVLSNSMSTKSYADAKKRQHLTNAQFKKIFSIPNEKVMEDIGKSAQIKSLSYDNITFKSSNCYSSGAVKASARNFEVSAKGTFTISVPSKYVICGVEFLDDVSGDVNIDNSNSGFTKINGTEGEDKDEYFLFSNAQSTTSSLKFKATGDGFLFEEINVYVYEVPTRYTSTPPTTLYMGGKVGVLSYQFLPKSEMDYRTNTLTATIDNSDTSEYLAVYIDKSTGIISFLPKKPGEVTLRLDIRSDQYTGDAHWFQETKITIKDVHYYFRITECDGINTAEDFLYFPIDEPMKVIDPGPKEGYYHVPGFAHSRGYFYDTVPDSFEGIVFSIYHKIHKEDGYDCTCTSDGVKDYWYTDAPEVGGRVYFEDAAGTKVINNIDEWKKTAGNNGGQIPATGHKLTRTAGKAATCYSYGSAEYWYCSDCKKYFSDKDCHNEINDFEKWKKTKGQGLLDPTDHIWDIAVGRPATCTTDGYQDYYYCINCNSAFAPSNDPNKIFTDLEKWKLTDGRIPAQGHCFDDSKWCSDEVEHWHECLECGARIDNCAHTLKTTVTPATLSSNGKKETVCTVCNHAKNSDTIYAASGINLSATSYTYNGKTIKPSVTVNDSTGKKISDKFYSITYPSKAKNVGKYTVKVNLSGEYKGNVNLVFTVNPPKAKISKVSAGKKAFTVSWGKKTTQVTGYEIQYSTSSSFKSGNKTVKITSAKTASKAIKGLKAKKKYYVRIRTYKTVSGKKYYSDWSSKKSVTTKK